MLHLTGNANDPIKIDSPTVLNVFLLFLSLCGSLRAGMIVAEVKGEGEVKNEWKEARSQAVCARRPLSGSADTESTEKQSGMGEGSPECPCPTQRKT